MFIKKLFFLLCVNKNGWINLILLYDTNVEAIIIMWNQNIIFRRDFNIILYKTKEWNSFWSTEPNLCCYF